MTTVKTQSWKKMRFADFVDTEPKSTLKKDQEYPFIPMELVDGVSKYPTSYFKKKFTGGGTRFMDGDTIFARITPCLENGKIAQIKDLPENVGFGSTEFFVFRSKDGVSDKDFIYYLSRTDHVRSPAVKSMVGASGRQRANKTVIENLEILVPPLSEQHDISKILSVYDTLIENNTRRIHILEQMAQVIYAEYFATVAEAIVEKKKLPVGWKAENLYDVADIKMGYAFKANQFNEEQRGLRTVRIRDIPSGVATTYTTEEVNSSYLVKKGDFLIGMDGIFHMNHWQDEDALLVQRVCRVKPKSEKMRAYLALSLVKPVKHFEATLMGATVAHLGSRHLEEVFIAIPDSSFDQKLEYLNMFLDAKLQYSYQNQALRKTRDLLIPKLVTGEIAVK
ncbi:restriction endonuclease subunit S [Patescibacteria group bacterium]|uniref:Restriction endonuclease subunit S n=1 Tax=candidate division WWE3 bacterium TaxID=2053526 RepID=A0A928TPQ4_UNCKA|nr:restriction endonuclease subunit S [candidate division WWE3 bacterium]MCL4733183.1 restriction endonuclease subunit S [Patescibacteria group bacterium]